MSIYYPIILKSLGIFGVMIPLFYGIRQFMLKSRWFQPIYSLSPDTHQLKQYTPSLGGIGFLIAGAALLGLIPLTADTLWISVTTIAFGAIGFIDDTLAIRRQSNKGLTARQKATFQWIVAVIMVGLLSRWVVPISWLQGVWYAIILVGASNATNLTDGLDGLLSGLMLISLAGYAAVFASNGQWILTEFSILWLAIVAGFLVINRHPAKLFMGDTGSLSLGALLASLAMIYGNVWILGSVGMVYILETLSVILQVLWFKRTQRRLFLMAPLHHHFELLGLSEPWVVRCFWALGVLGVLIWWI